MTRPPNNPNIPPLGELEVEVLDQIWSSAEATVKEMHGQVGVERGISLNTVQSTLDRLYRKGLLTRRKQGHAYCYRPCVSREALVGSLISDILGRFSSDGPVAAAAFAAAVDELDAEALSELEAELRRRRKPSEKS